MKKAVITTLVGFLATAAMSAPIHAQEEAEEVKATGVVREVDVEHQKLTLAHDAIPAWHMDAETTAFDVADGLLFGYLWVGAKLDFTAVHTDDGAYRIVAMDPPKE